MSTEGRVERLSSRIWIGRDPGDRAISVSYSDESWLVALCDEIEQELNHSEQEG